MALLEVKNLCIEFGGLRAVNDFHMTINEHELVGLIGPNGAGKTTVFNMLTGVYKPTAGIIKLADTRIDGGAPDKIVKLGAARTFQNIRLFDQMNVIDNVKVAMSDRYAYTMLDSLLKDKKYKEMEHIMQEEAMQLLKVLGLEKLYNEKASNLPYGKQRKLEIARALATNPKLILLDEPAAGMNPQETEELMNNILYIKNNYDLAVLLIEHDMKLVMGICEKITVLNFGEVLAEGVPAEIKSNPEVIKAYLGS